VIHTIGDSLRETATESRIEVPSAIRPTSEVALKQAAQDFSVHDTLEKYRCLRLRFAGAARNRKA